jgi:hypothetical protein
MTGVISSGGLQCMLPVGSDCDLACPVIISLCVYDTMCVFMTPLMCVCVCMTPCVCGASRPDTARK